MNNIKFAIKYK